MRGRESGGVKVYLSPPDRAIDLHVHNSHFSQLLLPKIVGDLISLFSFNETNENETKTTDFL